jgi:O-antigen/teichoic acid export membrane protein
VNLTKVILRRSLGELVLNCVLCVLLVSWMGYLGAVVATLLTLYLYSVPFNLHAIGRGFGTRWTRVLPFGELGRIFGVGLLFLPLAVLPSQAGFLPPVAQLALAAILYWPATVLVLVRSGRLPLPPQLARLIPQAMQLLIKAK